MFMVFIMVMPRLVDSLHPGNGGNPGFGKYDLDSNMRMVFYPAVIGFTLLGVWILQILVRIRFYKQKQLIKNFK
jgi:heme exporter protein C